ncbi:hypothetical protein BJ085DRAFT_28286 [Dimargaris cristalligena]|uniref:Zn(2)-C6 fungal-type domain-containing protein n=1 Tax=Dimargaris cristalligena TaxID=215637 RepID=A0A4P9ZZD9_9FUNG|nr:hypothetical protein BJ085DRAFT_28286 [Dimargaris cristalligena]|eukprot:RKP38180.1 hypothetical protein BJ085DRAFT_28286 [Dimargaris cristalligena]
MGPTAPILLLPLPPTTLKGNSTSERSRYSCLNCRKRKVRCNRLLPRCTTCQQWNSDCRYHITPPRLHKTQAHLLGNIHHDSACDSSTPESPSPTQGPPSRLVPLDVTAYTHRATLAPTADSPPSSDSSRTVSLAQTAYTDSARNPPSPEGPLYIPVDLLLDFPANALDIPIDDFTNNISPIATLPSPSFTQDPARWNLLPNWLVAGINQLNVDNSTEDTLSLRTARLILKLMGNSPASRSPSDFYPGHTSSLANSTMKEYGSEKGSASLDGPLADTSSGPPCLRSLFSPVDLLFHSSVVRHSIDDFCSLNYRGNSPLHRLRILYRLDNQLVPEAYQLAAMLAVAPFSKHPAFERASPHMISSLGLLTLHQSLLAASIRKQHSIRSYLIDHPNPPPRLTCLNADPGIIVDAPTIRNEFIRQYYRMIWWAHFGKDMMAALIFGHKPLIDMDICYVNLPSPDRDIEARLEAELANPDSDIFTGKDYPTMVNNSRIKTNVIVVKAEVSIIGHRIAQLRARQATDPAAWLQALPGLNHELDLWYNRFTEMGEKDWRTSPYTVVLFSQSEADSFCIRVRIMCAMLAIYLNHFDGHSPDSTVPYPGSALNDALQATGDSMDRTLSECHERCWTYTLRLRELMIKSPTPPAFISNTLFSSSLYPAAVVCNERIHGMGSAYPNPVDPADRKLATLFIDEIIQGMLGILDASRLSCAPIIIRPVAKLLFWADHVPGGLTQPQTILLDRV